MRLAKHLRYAVSFTPNNWVFVIGCGFGGAFSSEIMGALRWLVAIVQP